MSPSNVQSVLKDSRYVIQKLAGSLGIDLSELDENYYNICERLDAAIEDLEGEQ